MKDIHEVLRRKQAQYAQLGRQIEALQSAAEKLRMVAPLLAEEGDANTEAGRNGSIRARSRTRCTGSRCQRTRAFGAATGRPAAGKAYAQRYSSLAVVQGRLFAGIQFG
jgi:hypothetical protein